MTAAAPALAALAALLGSPIDASPSIEVRELTVCTHQAPGAALFDARVLVDRLFRDIDLRVHWKTTRTCPADGIPLHFRHETPPALSRGAFGRALPLTTGRAEIFYDRIRAAVPDALVPSLLAHVIAHEVAHVAQATRQHGTIGLMKARWTADEIVRMAEQPLRFAAVDAALIKDGLARRRISSVPDRPPAGSR